MIALKKLLVFILFFCILIVVKEIVLFGIAWSKGTHEDFSIKRQVILGAAISYIFTIIFTGFALF